MIVHCKQCGTALSKDSLGGHCPRCLIHTAFDSNPAEESLEDTGAFPRSFGEFELLEEVARGGMGVVYRARQRNLNRQVAIKMILAGEFASPEFVRRFRQEATAAASLQHPNIVTIHEVGEVEGQHYFSMDFVEGRNLAETVRSEPLPARRAAGYLKSIAEAIQYAHRNGILHRDLKPSNILVDPFDQPRITDFGVAKQFNSDSELTVTGQTLGSPAYIPPEQSFGRSAQVDPRSDIYSLGAVLYHTVTGRPPFQGETLHQILLQAQRTEPIPPRRLNPGVPEDLQTICLKCLEKNPGKRYQSSQELADDLGRFLRTEPIVARPVGYGGKALRWCQRRPVVAALTTTVVLLVATLVAGSLFAAWRIELARRAESAEGERAARANVELTHSNTRLAETVSTLELQRAEGFFRSGDSSRGLANLAGVLRRDSSNHVAANRILSVLLHRNWVLPAGAPLQHPGLVSSVAFSASGRYIVTGCADGLARIWDAENRRQIGIGLKHPARVRGVMFSPDEASVATACEDGQVRIWNWRTGELTAGPMKHDGWVFSVGFSPNGEQVVSACDDHIVRVWSARTGDLLLTLVGHTGAVRKAVFSPDGRIIATASYDGSARLWDAQSGRPIGSTLRHENVETAVLGVAFSPDGSRVATSSRDRTAVIWNVDTGTPIGPALQHPDGLNDVQFDPTGRMIVTTGLDNAVRLWEAASDRLLSQPFRHLEQVNQAAFSADGQTLVTASDDTTVKFWDVRPTEALTKQLRHQSSVRDVEFSSDGILVVTASSDRTARVWNGSTALPITGPLQHGGPVRTASFSPDGQFVVTASTDYSPWIWEVRTGNRTDGLFLHSGGLWSAVFSPEGRRLLTASADRTARVWDFESRQPITPPLQHAGDVRMARFSPDGTRVVTASADHTARVWNSKTGAPVTKGLSHEDEVRDGCFSPDGLRVATASADNTARIWDARSGQPVGRILRHLRTVEAIAFSPDGLRVVTASLDHTVRVWDATTGEPLTPPLEHDDGVLQASFSPDGHRILTASMDRTARIWDAKTGLPVGEPLWHKGPVSMARFSPDGARVTTAALAPDNAARIWQVPEVPARIPDWLPALAEAVAGFAVETEGTTRLVSEAELDRLRDRLTKLTDNDNLSRVARWFFAARAGRTVSPFESETVAEYVLRRIQENTQASLETAIRLDCTNALALARLAKAVVKSDPSGRGASDAANLARLALRFDPDQAEARDVIMQIQSANSANRDK